MNHNDNLWQRWREGNKAMHFVKQAPIRRTVLIGFTEPSALNSQIFVSECSNGLSWEVWQNIESFPAISSPTAQKAAINFKVKIM